MKRDYTSDSFSNPHELTKIVPKEFYETLRCQIRPFGPRNQKVILFFSIAHKIPGETKEPFQFLRHCKTFFENLFSHKRSSFNFLMFSDRMDVEKPLRAPISFFGIVPFFFEKCLQRVPFQFFKFFATEMLKNLKESPPFSAQFVQLLGFWYYKKENLTL